MTDRGPSGGMSLPRRIGYAVLVCLAVTLLPVYTFAEPSDDAPVFVVTGSLVQNTAPVETQVVLNGGRYSSPVRGDGTFKIHDVPAGIYRLEVLSPSHTYPLVRVSISSKNKRVTCTLIGDHSRQPLRYPLRLKPAQEIRYHEEEAGFNPMSLLGNWQFIMLAVTVLIVVVFPKMLDSLDEEELKKMQQQMGRDQENMNPTAMFNKLLGKPEDDDDD